MGIAFPPISKKSPLVFPFNNVFSACIELSIFFPVYLECPKDYGSEAMKMGAIHNSRAITDEGSASIIFLYFMDNPTDDG